LLGIVGCLTMSFSRGMITGLALHHDAKRAARSALMHLPALLVSSLVYSALVAGCLLGVSPIAKHNLILSRDSAAPIWLGWANALDDTRHQTAGEVLHLILPDAGAPFADLVPAARDALFKRPPQSEYEHWPSEQNGNVKNLDNDLRVALRHANLYSLLVLANIVLLIFTETLLRFRIVLAIKPLEGMPACCSKPGGYSLQWLAALSPLIDSVRLGWRHLGVITLHVWLLRLAGAVLMLLFVALPMAASTQVMTPALISLTGKTPLLPLWHFAQSCIGAGVMALWLAFSTIYDARLFSAFNRDTDRMRTTHQTSDLGQARKLAQ
jgi:hypothetical protein